MAYLTYSSATLDAALLDAFWAIRANDKNTPKELERIKKEILEASLYEKTDFSNWSEEERLEFINKELQSPRPFTTPKTKLGPNAKALVDYYRVVEEHSSRYGLNCIGSFIVSMTRSLSDLLLVYLFAREAGLTELTEEGLVCKIPVVPLLETIEDLQSGSGILEPFCRQIKV